MVRSHPMIEQSHHLDKVQRQVETERRKVTRLLLNRPEPRRTPALGESQSPSSSAEQRIQKK